MARPMQSLRKLDRTGAGFGRRKSRFYFVRNDRATRRRILRKRESAKERKPEIAVWRVLCRASESLIELRTPVFGRRKADFTSFEMTELLGRRIQETRKRERAKARNSDVAHISQSLRKLDRTSNAVSTPESRFLASFEMTGLDCVRSWRVGCVRNDRVWLRSK